MPKNRIPTYRDKEKPMNDKKNREPMVIALATGKG
ncbi:ParA family protein, partial [Bifidobacterium bifidum]